MQAVGNRIQVFGLCHSPIISKRISMPNHLITSITCFDQTLRYIAHINNRNNILAGANQKTFTGLDKGYKSAKAGGITRTIDPPRSGNHYRRIVVLDQVSNQLLSCNLAATIWIILGMIWMVFAYNTTQMMTIDRDRTRVDNALHSGSHRCTYQVGQSTHIHSPVDLFQSPWPCF